MVVGGYIPPMDRGFFKDFLTVHPNILKGYMSAAKAGKLPARSKALLGRTVHNGGSVAAGEHSLLWWMAQQLSNAIVGETASERLARGHRAAESRAESQLMKAAASNGSPPLVFKSNVPKSTFSLRIVRGKRRGSNQIHTTLEVTGTDFIGSVNVDAATRGGDILFDQVLAPGAFNETRLQQFSYLFDKYQFEDIKFHYSPLVDATTPGGIIAFPDYDPDDDLFNQNPGNIKKAAAHMGSAIVQVWDKHTWDFHALKKDVLLFTDPASTDDRLTQQGRFTVLAASDFTEALETGLITMSYKCHFFITQIDNNPPFVGVAYQADGNSSTAAKPYGTSVTVKPESNLSIQYSAPTNSVFTFPTGATTHRFFVLIHFAGAGLGALTTSMTAPDTVTEIVSHESATDVLTWCTVQLGGTNITHSLTILLAAATSFSASQICIFPIPEDFTARRNKIVIKDEIYELKSQVASLMKLVGNGNTPQDPDNNDDQQLAEVVEQPTGSYFVVPTSKRGQSPIGVRK